MKNCSVYEFDPLDRSVTKTGLQLELLTLRNLALDWNRANVKVDPFVVSDGGMIASRYVGHFTDDGCQFEVKPRIGWARLELMLDEVVSVALGGAGQLDRSNAQAPRGDLLALLWCLTLLDAWRVSGGAPRVFERRSATDCTSLRGRFDVASQVQCNQVNAHHLACIWDEATTDNAINRGILVVIDRLKYRHRYPYQKRSEGRIDEMQRRLNDIRSSLTGASVNRPPHFPANPVRWSRANDRFKLVHRLGRMLTEQETVPRQVGGHQETVLLDGAEIWEMFLFHRLKLALRRRCPTYTISWPRDEATDRRQLVEWQGSTGQLLIPDMLIKNGNECVAVVDAKYRHFRSPLEDRELACQMALYAGNYVSGNSVPIVVLIFPSINQASDCKAMNPDRADNALIGSGTLRVGDSDVQLIAWAIDLNAKGHVPGCFDAWIDNKVGCLVDFVATKTGWATASENGGTISA